MTASGADKVTKEELEGKLRALQDGVTARVEDRKPSLIKVAAGVGLVILILAFLFGQRRGKRKSAIVEIRRF
jgi:hypothetical protein